MGQYQNGNILCGYVMMMMMMMMSINVVNVNGYEFKVGGSGNWSPPSDPNSNTYNQWAERSRFQIGDTLLFMYSGENESVLEVNKEDYNNCNTDNPIHKYTDGHTQFKFDHSGPYYFISGVKDHCRLNNQKLLLVVMADRSSRNQSPPSPSPSPSPSNSNGTAAPPPSNNKENNNNSPPSPAPSGEEAPSPPAASVEINPTPAPSTTEQSNNKPKKNGASSFSSSVGNTFFVSAVFLGSILLMVF